MNGRERRGPCSRTHCGQRLSFPAPPLPHLPLGPHLGLAYKRILPPPRTSTTHASTYLFLIAHALNEHALRSQTGCFENVHNVPSSFARGIGRIKRCNTHSVLFHIFDQIGQCGIACHPSGGGPFVVGGIVKGRWHLCATQLPTIITDIEDLRWNVVEETQKATNPFGNVRFSCKTGGGGGGGQRCVRGREGG